MSKYEKAIEFNEKAKELIEVFLRRGVIRWDEKKETIKFSPSLSKDAKYILRKAIFSLRETIQKEAISILEKQSSLMFGEAKKEILEAMKFIDWIEEDSKYSCE